MRRTLSALLLLALLLPAAPPTQAQPPALALVFAEDVHGPAADLTVSAPAGALIDLDVTVEAPLRVAALVVRDEASVACAGAQLAFACTATVPASGSLVVRLLLDPLPAGSGPRTLAVSGLGETATLMFGGSAPAVATRAYLPMVIR